ncbi:hypothetical protein [Streptomyces sp. NBC_01334]|nr:hypothetical protein OG736_41690 [Streptomyces sp. NBC_01334]
MRGPAGRGDAYDVASTREVRMCQGGREILRIEGCLFPATYPLDEGH